MSHLTVAPTHVGSLSTGSFWFPDFDDDFCFHTIYLRIGYGLGELGLYTGDDNQLYQALSGSITTVVYSENSVFFLSCCDP